MEAANDLQNDHVSTSQEETKETPSSRSNLRRKVSVVPETRPSLEESSDDSIKAKAGPASYKRHYANNKTKSWEASYDKVYVCRLCGKHCKNRGNIRIHFRTHKIIINNDLNIFKKYCTVNLERLDKKPNITGVDNTVVFNQNKIASEEGKMHYYVLYKLKDEFKTEQSDSESSDYFAPKFRAKRIRMLSESSADTVILSLKDATSKSSDHEQEITNNEEKENVPEVVECIDLSDSSADDETHNDDPTPSSSNMRDTTDNSQPLPTDRLTISNIVSACHIRYMNKIESSMKPEKQTASNKSKLLNIGLRSIFQQGYKCTGLLRYLEHDHLEIKWIPINDKFRANSKESKYVRIMPRVKGKEDAPQDYTSWNPVTYHPVSSMEQDTAATKICNKEKNTTLPTFISSLDLPLHNSSAGPVVNEHTSVDHTQQDSAVLYSKAFSGDADRKLLNANPVANPKQLPKKIVPSEIKSPPAPLLTGAVMITNSSPVLYPKHPSKKAVPSETKASAAPTLKETVGHSNTDAKDSTSKDKHITLVITSTKSLTPNKTTTNQNNDVARSEENIATPGKEPNTDPVAIKSVPTETKTSPAPAPAIIESKMTPNAIPAVNTNGLPKEALPSGTKTSPEPTAKENHFVAIFSPDQDQSNSNIQPIVLEDRTWANEHNYNFMPIITSTTSLAPDNIKNKFDNAARNIEKNASPKSTESEKNPSSSHQPDAPTPAPRIKVKNVAELMTAQALSNQNAINTTQRSMSFAKQNQKNTTPINQQTQITNATTVNYFSDVMTRPTTSSQVISATNSGPREFVVLHSLEMPNTRTSSPFKYLKTLLQMRNIVLLDATTTLTSNFECLIKFKLHFSQESMNPVVLSLSLHCHENKICIGVKDLTHPDYIDLNKLTANWQWEILKIYKMKELVVNKLYQNSQKFSQTMFWYINTFVATLQSIQLITNSL